MKSFHEGCLQKFGDLSSEVSKLHAKAIAKSAVGWSCYKCVRLIFHVSADCCKKEHLFERSLKFYCLADLCTGGYSSMVKVRFGTPW